MPMVKRHKLRINSADAATNAGDTGTGLSGRIEQIQWVPTTADTGADISLMLVPSLAGSDTAGSFPIYSKSDCLGAAFLKAPRQPACANDGFDTGVDAYVPYVLSPGDRLRVKTVAAGNGAVAGTLHVWLADGNP